MRYRRSLFIFCAAILAAGVLFVALAPFAVSTGLPLWVTRVARQDGLNIECGKIEAPFLRPVIVHDLKITSSPGTPFHVLGGASRVELDLNLPALFFPSRGRVLRSLNAEKIAVDIRRDVQTSAASRPFRWTLANNFLAVNFKLSGVQLHVENGSTVVDLHDATLSGAQIETGLFTARELTIASPWFKKSFSNLRGATSWEESRLTLGALTLMRGLDLDSITIDLSQIAESRLGLEMNMDAFGGKLRARVSSDDHADKRTWDVAGTASEISLAQMSDALAWENRASGSLRACKFTFRGEVTNIREATAAVWSEIAGATWRDRTADTIMLGAALHNREVQIEQLYIKQRNNQMTLSGEFALPQGSADWLQPDFRGDVSASINDLGDFARLIGANPADFAGKVALEGSVNARERKLVGQLTLSGDSLILSRAPVESLRMKFSLKESRLEMPEFALRRQSDFFLGEGSFDLSGDRAYSGTLKCSVGDVADYAGLIPKAFEAFRFGGGLALEWTAIGTRTAHSGTFHAKGNDLHSLKTKANPFNAEFTGDYSPENIFFRQFHLWNPRADFSAFVTVAKDYVQLKTLRFDLNGKPKLQGNVFAPFSLAKLRAAHHWRAALSVDPTFDIDVTLDPIDLAELADAVTPLPKMSGQAAGKIEVYGTPAALEGKSDLHVRDFVWEEAMRVSADLEAHLAVGTLGVTANATASGSAPVRLDATIPFQLEKRESGIALLTEGPISLTLNFPAIFLAKMPRYVSRGIFHDGILSGQLAISESLGRPRVLGEVQLIEGKFAVGATLSTRLTFGGQTGVIEFAQLKQNGAQLSARGEIDFSDSSQLNLKLVPNTPLLASFEAGDCVTGLELSPMPGNASPSPPIHKIDLRGSLFASGWTISLSQTHAGGSLDAPISSPRTFSFCLGEEATGKTLMLQPAPGSIP